MAGDKDSLPLALTLLQRRRLAEAETIYQAVLREDPAQFDALHYLGLIMLQTGRTPQGVRMIGEAIVQRPNFAPAYNNLGIGLAALGRYAEALASYDRAIALQPDFPHAHDNRGNALLVLGRSDDAVASFDKAIALRPDDAGVHTNRGTALHGLRRYAEALASHDQAIALQPNLATAHHNRGIVLQGLDRLDDGLASFDRAIALAPNYVGAHNGRGGALLALHRYDAALASFDQAIALKADFVQAHINRGSALQALDRYDDAFDSYGAAIRLNPASAEAHYSLGDTLLRLRRYQEAVASYEQALAARPRLDTWYGNYAFAQRQVCDWTGEDEIAATIAVETELGHCVTSPFQSLSSVGDPALQRKMAEIFVRTRNPARDVPVPRHGPHDKIRIGYFSADFREHAMMSLMIGLFEAHDRSRFELTAFSFGPDVDSPMRQQVTAAFDRFIDVGTRQNHEIAGLARELEIDIAVDLIGFTRQARTGIFSFRAAPIQVNYLGYPGTMGAEYIDYIVADPVVIPAGAQRHFTERVVWLPDSYQVNDRNRQIAPMVFNRTELGLPESGFVFCCFNAPYKITPPVFDSWMRILAAVPGSVLWLFEDNPVAPVNLRKEAAARGIDPGRLIFAARVPPSDHLARLSMADLFLDTRPYNAHTTASDALWAGLPVLTSPGGTFASRVAASLLTAIGLPDLITTTMEAYETTAIALATQPGRPNEIKTKLAAHRLTTPLFDTERYTRNLEAAFAAMVARHQAGLPPEDLAFAFPSSGG
jgi:predicted O-linked N-acetylglucosamine transferase (SPINDLY family)